ncbi:MAG TPA: S-adenosylmethionine decarboxylase [Streptosporangiaceae bacterium]|nr:S-adenosylmethionine decarboxylase [Streptosporangiaceae bacterium]
MPGIEPASRFAELRRHEAASPKQLYAVDARSTRDSAVHDLATLTAAAVAAVGAGGGHVLDESNVVFPNGAITLVLILAESHLSVHTWPEEGLVAIDLFSCGAIDGEAVIGALISDLGLTSVAISRLPRGGATA